MCHYFAYVYSGGSYLRKGNLHVISQPAARFMKFISYSPNELKSLRSLFPPLTVVSSIAAWTDFPVSSLSTADSCRPASLGVWKGPSSWQKKVPYLQWENGQSQWDFTIRSMSPFFESQLLYCVINPSARIINKIHTGITKSQIPKPEGWCFKVRKSIVGFHKQLKKARKNGSNATSIQLHAA